MSARNDTRSGKSPQLPERPNRQPPPKDDRRSGESSGGLPTTGSVSVKADRLRIVSDGARLRVVRAAER